MFPGVREIPSSSQQGLFFSDDFHASWKFGSVIQMKADSDPLGSLRIKLAVG